MNNKTYIGSELGDLEYPLTFSAQNIKDTLEKYNLKKGSILDVHYKIDDPKDSSLFLTQPKVSVKITGLSILAILCLFTSIFTLYKKNTLKTTKRQKGKIKKQS